MPTPARRKLSGMNMKLSKRARKEALAFWEAQGIVERRDGGYVVARKWERTVAAAFMGDGLETD